MKRLLIASDCFLPRWDGVARFLSEIIPRLLEDYNITVLAPDFPGEFQEPDSYEIVRFPLLKIMFGDIYFSRVKHAQVRKYISEADVVFVQTIGPIGLMAIYEAKKQKKPVVAYIHSIDWELATKSVKRFKRLVNHVVRKIANRAYNNCTLLMVPYEEAEEKLRKNRIETECVVVRLGTDTQKFKPAPKSKAKIAVNIDPKCVVIGFCGRIGREKDLMTLYRAFRKVEKIHPDTKLLIVGSGIRQLVREFSSSRNIILTGSQNNVVPYLQAMDIYVLPSLTETTSLSTLEAMSCGCAVITTPVGYVKEYIKDRENGMFFPFHNSLVLSLKIEQLINDDKLRQRLGQNARKTVEERFSWKSSAEKIKSVLQGVQ
ncbi:MAG: glycosyltransferase family 4 protein [Candidatus Woesearchaeota archaeon]